MATNKPNIPQEEVDLGSLFSQIGNMFSNFFNFIGNIFKSIYHYLIILILFIRKNILILGGATLIGALVGLLFIKGKAMRFTSEMTVEVAQGSGVQLYNQLTNLNNLLINGKKERVSELFGITADEAGSLVIFKAEAVEKKKNIYLAFDKYMRQTDTIYTREFTFKDFAKRTIDSDLRHQLITVEGRRPEVFEKLSDSMNSIVGKGYYESLVMNKAKELLFEKSKIEAGISQLDSLRKRYKEIAYLQSEQKDNDNSGFIYQNLAGYKGNPDIDVFKQSDSLFIRLRKVNELIVDNESVLKVQSPFILGKVKERLLDRPWFKYGLIGFGLAFLVLLSIQFNRYLNKYENIG